MILDVYPKCLWLYLHKLSLTSISSSKYASLSVILFKWYPCGSCGDVEFRSGWIIDTHSLYLIARDISMG